MMFYYYKVGVKSGKISKSGKILYFQNNIYRNNNIYIYILFNSL